LFDRIGEADLILPEIGGFLHPLAALYRRRTVLPEVNRLLEAGRGRMLDLIDRVNTIRLDASQLADLDPNFSTLRNVNTLEEYEALLRDFRSDE
jgi:molybdopterin-guanine dinucleotide biosynthesis protein A